MKQLNIKVKKMHPVRKESNTKAFYSVIIDNTYLVTGIKIMNGRNGLFVSMPQQKGLNDKWYNIFCPITKELYQQFQEIILKDYLDIMNS
jgi:stage V sporulation protein G